MGESQVRTLTPNFTVVALIMWAYSSKNRQNGNFGYKFSPKGKLWGSIESLDAQLETTVCNGAIIVLKSTLLA